MWEFWSQHSFFHPTIEFTVPLHCFKTKTIYVAFLSFEKLTYTVRAPKWTEKYIKKLKETANLQIKRATTYIIKHRVDQKAVAIYTHKSLQEKITLMAQLNNIEATKYHMVDKLALTWKKMVDGIEYSATLKK